MSLKSISSLGYVVLPCRDIQALRRFYRDLMGLPIAYERADWIQFQVGATALALRPLDEGLRDRRAERPTVQLGTLRLAIGPNRGRQDQLDEF